MTYPARLYPRVGALGRRAASINRPETCFAHASVSVNSQRGVVRSSVRRAWVQFSLDPDSLVDAVALMESRGPVKAVFLDRDGVINQNRLDHVKSWSEFRFLPGAPEAVARLSRAGVRVFVVTNQAIINRGMVPRATVALINQLMVREIAERGGCIEDVAYCPHRPDEGCSCRKPRPGLLLQLAQKHALDLRETAIVGDSLADVAAGQAVGCQAILVLTGRGREQLGFLRSGGENGFAAVADLAAAVELLLSPTAVLS